MTDERNTILSVVSRGETVTIDKAKLSQDILDQACDHGLTQKIADAAAGALSQYRDTNKDVADDAKLVDLTESQVAAVAAIGKGLMETVIASLLEDKWGATRSGGAQYTALDLQIISIMRQAVKGADAAWYKNATESEIKVQSLAAFTALTDVQSKTVTEVATAKLAALKATKALQAALGKTVEIDLDGMEAVEEETATDES